MTSPLALPSSGTYATLTPTGGSAPLVAPARSLSGTLRTPWVMAVIASVVVLILIIGLSVGLTRGGSASPPLGGCPFAASSVKLKAVAAISNQSTAPPYDIQGTVTFTQDSGSVVCISVRLTGVPSDIALHGLHVHSSNAIATNCGNAASNPHFNPYEMVGKRVIRARCWGAVLICPHTLPHLPRCMAGLHPLCGMRATWETCLWGQMGRSRTTSPTASFHLTLLARLTLCTAALCSTLARTTLGWGRAPPP